MKEKLEQDLADELLILGAKIKKTRTERGLSVRDMVVQHDYHEAQWRRYERGSSLTLPSLMRIAKALETSLSRLLDGIGEYSTARASKRNRPVKKAAAVTRKARR